MLQVVVPASMQRCPEFEPQHLALTAWALAVMASKDLSLLDMLAQVAVMKISQFGHSDEMSLAPCQDLAMMLWAFATLEFRHEPALDALEAAATSKVQQFNPQNVANIS